MLVFAPTGSPSRPWIWSGLATRPIRWCPNSRKSFTGHLYQMPLFNLEGYKSSQGAPLMVGFTYVGPGAFSAMGVPVLHGREMELRDFDLNRKVVVVNESFVKEFWP